MRARAGLLALLLLAAPAGSRAQGAVDPGGVATTVVSLSPPAGAASDSVTYRVEMAEGFRLFARPAGRAAAGPGPIRLPLTFGVSPRTRAGEVQAGRVVATWAPGVESSHPVVVRVRPRYELRFWIAAEVVTATPGETVELGYRLGNRGNTVDTVALAVDAPAGWSPVAVPPRVVIAAGDTAAGTIRLRPGPDSDPGTERFIRVSALGVSGRETRSVRLVVVGESRWFGDLASLPSTVFVGSSSGMDGLGGVSVRAAGELRPGTHASLDLRHTDQPIAAPAFRGALTGPAFRLRVRSEDWQVAAGDVYTLTDLFTGPSVHGSGLDARWQDGTTGATVFLARPAGTFGSDDGHVLRASGHVPAGPGRLTAVISDVRRRGGIVEGYGVRSAGLRFDTGPAGNRLTIEAGGMRVAADSGSARSGPTLAAEYAFRGPRGSLTARLRTVPATVPRNAAHGDEILVSGAATLTGDISAIGWGFLSRSPLLDVREAPTSRGLVAGLRYVAPVSAAQVQVTGNLRDSDAPDRGAGGTRRSVRGDVRFPVGPVAVEVDGEWGRAEDVFNSVRTEAPFGSIRAGTRWHRETEWAWAGLVYRDYGIGAGFAEAELAGAVRAGPAEIQGGLIARLDAPPADGVHLWTGTTVDIRDDMAATFGLDYSPSGIGDRWRFSLGLSRTFALPLPVRREPAAYGVVYEDHNGNRVRDADEPALPGVVVRLGPLSATTGPEGGFRFMDRANGALRLESAALPLGLMVPADVHLPAAGYVEIPVVRTAAVELTLFLDRDGDGEWDDLEGPAEGVILSLVAPDGRTRDVAVDARGRARFGAVSPGEYTLRIHPPASRTRGAGRPIERSLRVPPGGTVRQTLAVPLRQREIRIPPDAQSGVIPPTPAGT